MGCVIDGCPAGLEINENDIEKELSRRRPGSDYGSRNESDIPQILSGVFEGKTLGSPIAIIVQNENQKSGDYNELKNIYRPGHADLTWEIKYGFRDHRGGGRSSGRETLCRVAAGAVAKKLLALHSMNIRAWCSSIAGIELPLPGEASFDINEIDKNLFRVPCKEGAYALMSVIEKIKMDKDSAGGIISCLVTGVKAGLGEPVFDKLDARLSHAIMSIGACKGIEIGSGFAAAAMKGSENNDTPNDPFKYNQSISALPMTDNSRRPDNKLKNEFSTNNCGGVLGGISTGQDIFFRAAFKPTPSIGKHQRAFNKDGGIVDMEIKGRHDVCIAPRAVPVVEAMTALTLADLLLLGESCTAKAVYAKLK